VIVNGVLVTSLLHLRSLCVGMDNASKDALISMYTGTEIVPKSVSKLAREASTAEDKVIKIQEFNKQIQTEMITENIEIGISDLPNGRALADAAFSPVFDEMSKFKYPEALYKLAVLKANKAVHISPIITEERIQKYYDKITVFLESL
jgi:hypothetical protein